MIEAARNITFKSANAQTPKNSAVPIQNVDMPASKPDEFVKQDDENEKKMSKGKIAAIAGGVLAIGGIITAIVLSRGKKGTKSIEQALEPFKAASTVEEAKAYAKDKLGVHIIDDMNLDVLNYMNEGLYELRSKFPKEFKISFVQYRKMSEGDDDVFMQGIKYISKDNGEAVYGICVNPDFVSKTDGYINAAINNMLSEGSLVDDGVIKASGYFAHTNIQEEIVQLINKFRSSPKSISFTDKMKINMGTGEFSQYMDNLWLRNGGSIPDNIEGTINITYSPFHAIFHEQGHILNEINDPEKFRLLFDSSVANTKYYDFRDPKKFVTALKVTNYAVTNPAEFVAEVYTKNRIGVKFDDDVISLYDSYGGYKLA